MRIGFDEKCFSPQSKVPKFDLQAFGSADSTDPDGKPWYHVLRTTDGNFGVIRCGMSRFSRDSSDRSKMWMINYYFDPIFNKMYEEQNKMRPGDFEQYLFLLEAIASPKQTTMIVDTDYNNRAVIYNCGTLLDGLLYFDDFIVLTKNSVNYNVQSPAIKSAILSLTQAFRGFDMNSMSGPYIIQDNCP